MSLDYGFGTMIATTDYCIVLYEYVDSFDSFKVVRSAQIYADSFTSVESRIVSDHLLLMYQWQLKFPKPDIVSKTNEITIEKRCTKYTITKIPENVCNDENAISFLQDLCNFETICNRNRSLIR